MSIESYSIKYYACTCDKCGKREDVRETEKIYNGAQAARSLGWKYGKDKTVKCTECRKHDWEDHYSWHTSVSASK